MRITKCFALCLALALLLSSMMAPAAQAASVSKTLKKKVTSIVNKQTKTSDSKKQKLKKLFKYAEKNWGYARAYGFDSSVKNWDKSYAVAMYKSKKGSCYHFAAAYAYLAKKATGYTVRIGIGKTNGFGNGLQAHAWVEIKIGSKWYVCDPNMDKFMANSSLKYFLKKRSKLKSTYNKYKSVKYVTVTL